MTLYEELIDLSRHIESPFLDRMVIYIGVNFTKMSASIFKKDVVKIILSGKNSVPTLDSILLKLHLCKAEGVTEFWLHAQGSVWWDGRARAKDRGWVEGEAAGSSLRLEHNSYELDSNSWCPGGIWYSQVFSQKSLSWEQNRMLSKS